jgi:hypothetical protein
VFSIHDLPTRLCDGVNRRELLRIGGLSALGLTLPNLLHARDTAPLGVPPTDKTFGKAKNVIFLYLAGGPPQHETFDPKPNAPSDIRGPFNPISTNVAGTQFCELLPRTAAIADKLAVVRSMATDDNIHSSSSHWVLTGYKYQGPNARTLQPTDWPYFGSLVKMLKPSDTLPPLSTVWVPDVMRLNENVTPAGQTGGFLGSQWDPDRFVGDPSDPRYKVDGLQMVELAPLRMDRRRRLLKQVDAHFDATRRGGAVELFGQYQQQAFDLLTSGKARTAFDIGRETDAVRERYGRNRWGQCVLLARRLIEAGSRLVHVQWPREPGDNAVDNPLWDTHAQNADRVEDVLCPTLDVGFTALIEDLEQRGLLDETLVVAIGEFGRTPKINAKGGRDHWGSVFSCVLAGAGISGGQVLGASDKDGGYPAADRVEPGDLTATIFHLLGIPYMNGFHDREGREHRLTLGQPMFKLLGVEPTNLALVKSTGDVTRVPPFDPTITLSQTNFAGDNPLKPIDAPSRPKGWRATPLLKDDEHAFGIKVIAGNATMGIFKGGLDPSEKSENSKNPSPKNAAPKKGEQVVIAQEVRSPFAGTYKLMAHIQSEAASQVINDSANAHFTFKLQFFEYTSRDKKASGRKELAATQFTLQHVAQADQGEKPDYQKIELAKQFVNPAAGANFSFGNGLGVAIIIERKTAGDLPANLHSPWLHIKEVNVEFQGKQRNKDVKV